MSKQTYRESRRVAPLGLQGLEQIRAIIAQHQAAKVNEVLVDLFSASAIVAVFDAVNEANREKLLALPVAQVADICFKVINKGARS